jgi:hypothetical protein
MAGYWSKLTFCHLCRHCTSVLPFKLSEIFFQFLPSFASTAFLRHSSSVTVHLPMEARRLGDVEGLSSTASSAEGTARGESALVGEIVATGGSEPPWPVTVRALLASGLLLTLASPSDPEADTTYASSTDPRDRSSGGTGVARGLTEAISARLDKKSLAGETVASTAVFWADNTDREVFTEGMGTNLVEDTMREAGGWGRGEWDSDAENVELKAGAGLGDRLRGGLEGLGKCFPPY